jgi:diguanylate cyclase (GGDEF)-like protein/PAS domain S-box-containing protein
VGDLLEDAPEELRARCTHVVSELVTNSVKHSGSTHIVLQVWPETDGGVAVDVSDTGPGFDILPRAAGHDDPEGWGLMFVDMLSDAWGSGGEGSPAVWAQFEPRSIDDDLLAPDPVFDTPLPDLLDVRMLLDSVKDYAIFALDTNGAITLWNAGAERLTGYGAGEVLGVGLAGMFDDAVDEAGDLSTALSHGRHEFQRWMKRKDGSRFWADCVLTPIFDGAHVLRGFSSVARDVTWRKRLDEDREDLIERIRVLARTDDLTSLANRRRWHEDLDHEMARARRQQTTLCVAMVDMDGFKVFNDTNGHQAGDALLQQTSSAWAEALRTTDTLARYGGDEFSVILPDCPLDEALAVIERLRQSTPGPATCSAGLACSDGAEPAESLVRRADLALYEAKRSGRNATVAV